MSQQTTVSGHVDERFEGVRAAFERNFTERGDSGAAVSVSIDGKTVVDLWGGMANHRTSTPWEPDTLQLVFSTTKGLTAAGALLAWERGQLDIDAPVATIWPEFGVNGKERITTRDVLSHRAGLAAFTARISAQECSQPGLAAARLAAQTPDWEPGTAHGYHALTYGWLVGEIVERAVGRSLGQYFAEEIAEPNELETYIGLPTVLERRVSLLRNAPLGEGAAPTDAFSQALLTKGTITRRVFSNPQQTGIFNDPALHQVEWPAANGITTARSLAKFYGLLGTETLLSKATLDAAETDHSRGPDVVLLRETAFGLGFMLPSEFTRFASTGGGFGHPGAGGSVGFADRRLGLGFGYVMTRMHAGLTVDERSTSLIDAVYQALDSAG